MNKSNANSSANSINSNQRMFRYLNKWTTLSSQEGPTKTIAKFFSFATFIFLLPDVTCCHAWSHSSLSTTHRFPISLGRSSGLLLSPSSTSLHLHGPFKANPRTNIADDSNNNNSDTESSLLSSVSLMPSSSPSFPTKRPLLAALDVMALVGFAALGKAFHNTVVDDGGAAMMMIDVAITAFPFVFCWLALSPITGVYSNKQSLSAPKTGNDDDDKNNNNNLFLDTLRQTAKGWIVAVPFGCALRGLIRGYIPPLSFVVVTMIATLVILTVARFLFAIAEDFFVELVN